MFSLGQSASILNFPQHMRSRDYCRYWCSCLFATNVTFIPGEMQEKVVATLRWDNAAAIAILHKDEVTLRSRRLSTRAEHLRSLPANINDIVR